MWAKRRSRFGLLLRIAASLLLITLLLSFADWQAFRRAAGQLSATALISMLLCYVIAQSALVLRWRVLLAAIGLRETWARSWHSVFAGLFLTNFLPGTLGSDGLRIMLIARHSGSASRAIGAIAYERAMQLGLYMGLAALAVVVTVNGLPPIWRASIAGGGIAGLFILLAAIYWMGQHEPPASDPSAGRRVRLWRTLLQTLAETGRMQRRIHSDGGLAFGFWGAGAVNAGAIFAAFMILLADLGHHPGLPAVILASSASAVATALPISFNGIGLYELALTWFLAAAGIPTTDAIFVALAMRILVVAVSVIGWPSLLVVRPGRGSEA